jgi:hypothetical protein
VVIKIEDEDDAANCDLARHSTAPAEPGFDREPTAELYAPGTPDRLQASAVSRLQSEQEQGDGSQHAAAVVDVVDIEMREAELRRDLLLRQAQIHHDYEIEKLRLEKRRKL